MKRLYYLWQFMKGNRVLYIISVLAIGVATFMSFLWPMVLRVTVDSIIGEKALEAQGWLKPIFTGAFNFFGGREGLVTKLWICAVLLVGITLIRGVFLYFKGKWSAVASESIAEGVRDRVYDHLQKLPYEYHVKAKTGDLIQRCTSDVETVRRFLAIQFVEVGRALFMVGFALSFMILMSVPMTLVSMSLVPFIFSFAVLFFIKVKRAFQLSDESEGRMSTVLQENLSGVRVVRAFARQAYEIDKFDKKNAEFRDLTYRLIRLLAWYWSVSDFVSLIQIAAVLVLGTFLAATGKITLGTLLAFSSFVGMMLWPIRQMGRVLTDMGKTMVSVGRIHEILDEPIEDLGDEESCTVKGAIEFDNVSFAYEDGKPVLHNVSFNVKPGQTVAILGPTGSGKSSLVHLLPRLYDYTIGSIKIDGKELCDIDKHAIRKNVGIVMQEPFLFSRTLKENIGICDAGYDDDAVFEAAQIASIHEVIESFQKGYETAVGERGVTLSGGQKQRVAIARTIMRNTPILIFDDSLSAVDTETDAEIRSRLKKRTKKATTFIISHRVNTLSEADLILVLEHGRLVQKGSHDELISQPGLYQRIWTLQNSLEDELEKEAESDNVKLGVDKDDEITSIKKAQ